MWGRAAIAVLLAAPAAGCARTISEVHARAVHQHLEGLERAARRIASDAPRHPRCLEGEDPVAPRAREAHAALRSLEDRAKAGLERDWESKDAFQEALADTATQQRALARLRAEYAHCRALSARPTDDLGVPWAPGTDRVALAGLLDLGGVLDPGVRAEIEGYVRARLSERMALVPEAASLAAREAHLDARGACPKGCALALARDVGAAKVLVIELRRVEDRCAVALSMYDAHTGVTERARTVRQDCSRQSVIAGIEDAVQPLGG